MQEDEEDSRNVLLVSNTLKCDEASYYIWPSMKMFASKSPIIHTSETNTISPNIWNGVMFIFANQDIYESQALGGNNILTN